MGPIDWFIGLLIFVSLALGVAEIVRHKRHPTPRPSPFSSPKRQKECKNGS